MTKDFNQFVQQFHSDKGLDFFEDISQKFDDLHQDDLENNQLNLKKMIISISTYSALELIHHYHEWSQTLDE